MAVRLNKVLRSNPLNRDSSKWYLVQEKSGTVDLNEIAKDLNRRSSLSSGDVHSILVNLVETMPHYLKLGQTINLGDFGSFHLSVSSEGAETKEGLSAHNVKSTRLIFRPGPALKRNLEDISFEVEE